MGRKSVEKKPERGLDFRKNEKSRCLISDVPIRQMSVSNDKYRKENPDVGAWWMRYLLRCGMRLGMILNGIGELNDSELGKVDELGRIGKIDLWVLIDVGIFQAHAEVFVLMGCAVLFFRAWRFLSHL